MIVCRLIVPLWVLTGAIFKLMENTPALLPKHTVLALGNNMGLDLEIWLATLIGLELLAVAVMICVAWLARTWASNPFVGKREFQGLKVLMALLENWALKDANNRVLVVQNEGGTELHYIVSDLGTTFGKTGGQNSPMAFFRSIKGSRNEPDDYVKDAFIDEVRGNTVRLDYDGKNANIMRDISIEDARWIGGLLSRLSDSQIQDAFRAANYSAEQVQLLAGAVRKRINELTNLQPGTVSGASKN
jgi:hypothetical protein